MTPYSKFSMVGLADSGGGKTDAGIAWMLKGTVDPGFTGLVIRRNHTDLRQWIDYAIPTNK